MHPPKWLPRIIACCGFPPRGDESCGVQSLVKKRAGGRNSMRVVDAVPVPPSMASTTRKCHDDVLSCLGTTAEGLSTIHGCGYGPCYRPCYPLKGISMDGCRAHPLASCRGGKRSKYQCHTFWAGGVPGTDLGPVLAGLQAQSLREHWPESSNWTPFPRRVLQLNSPTAHIPRSESLLLRRRPGRGDSDIAPLPVSLAVCLWLCVSGCKVRPASFLPLSGLSPRVIHGRQVAPIN